MASESIGSVSTGQIPDDQDWIVWALKLGKRYVLRACGEPPDGCRLDVVWHSHELGEYPTLAVSCDDDTELPWDYIEACERAFEVFDEAVDWSALKDHLADVEEDEDDDESATDDDEPPTHITVTIEVTD